MGKPPRRLTMLHLDGSQDVLPLHGTEIFLDDVVVGFVGASAQHFELGPIASAVVKRNLDPTAVVTVLGQQASQETEVSE
jgi:folate-binding Fe-S cluster repair protein YgfZ